MTTVMGSELAIRDDQTFFSEKQLAALRQLGVDRAGNADVAIFFHHCQRTGLDPFARQIYMIERQGKQTIQTGIDGFRLIARRAADRQTETLGYEDTLWCGKDGKWVDVWLADEHPAAAKVTVRRNGEPFPAVALWSEYVATKRDGSVTSMWQSKGALMLAKCAEALALRKAFPQDLSGIYTSDEMQQADNRQSQTRVQQAVAERIAQGPDSTDAGDVMDAEDAEFAALDAQRFEELIDGATTAAELKAIGEDIAASMLRGPAREELRKRFSDRMKSVAA